jgi:signal transduction histidine kinase
VAMGMGLVNAYNIIQKHKGEIQVESEVDKGTTFTVILPKDIEKALKS